MKLIHRIEIIPRKLLIGRHLTMTFPNNLTFELWNSFMPFRKNIPNVVGSDLYSIQVYEEGFFDNFDPGKTFEKWAAVEVTDFETIPEGMESLTLQGGLYAVFNYKGAASAGAATFQYIFSTWFPNSGYILDNRPHFEILGEKYRNEDPASEEEIWIPVRPKR
jgi:AraC family transcriptional regulator